MMTDKPEELALIRAIQANVEDDAPRWIIADWYEENGYPERAEFIRLELDLYKHYTHNQGKSVYITNCNRATELRTASGETWYQAKHFGICHAVSAGHKSIYGHGICQKSQLYTHRRNIGYTGDWQHNESRRAATEIEWNYHRGFINKLTIGTELWATHYETILTHYPITHVQTHGRVPIYRDEALHCWNVLLPNDDTIPCESYADAVGQWMNFFFNEKFREIHPSLMEITVQGSAIVPDC